jgi:hypothetical protein
MAFAVGGLRASIEAQMVDTCTITRQNGQPTVNANTGALTYPAPPAAVYAGKCLIDQMSARAKVLAGFDAELDVFDVALPMAATGIRRGDLLHVDACTNDAELAGDDLQVGPTYGAGTLAVTRRVAAFRIGPAQPTAAD